MKYPSELKDGGDIAINPQEDYIEFVPAGVSYRQEQWKRLFEIVQESKENEWNIKFKAYLVPEPTNTKDPNAIKVMIRVIGAESNKDLEVFHCGYISKKINQEIASISQYLTCVTVQKFKTDVFGKYYGGVVRLQYSDKPQPPKSRFQRIVEQI